MLTRAEQVKCRHEPFEVVVFGSGSGTNFEALLRDQKRWEEPPYRFQAAFSDRPCRFLDIAKANQILPLHYSFTDFFSRHSDKSTRDPHARSQYEQEIVSLLDTHVKKIDLIVLAGYMRLIYAPLLQRFKNKIINIHPADLTVCHPDGTRRYVGTNCVYDALSSGEVKTRSTVHIVNEEVDGGPIVVSGPWVHYDGPYPITKESAAQHQEKQKRLSDWPALTEAVALMSQRRLTLTDEGKVCFDGQVLAAGGITM